MISVSIIEPATSWMQHSGKHLAARLTVICHNHSSDIIIQHGVACWPLVPKIAGSNPAEAVGFFGRKNPQHAFLRRGSKAVCPMSQICGMLKTPGNYVEVGFSGEICRPFLAHFCFLLPEGSHVVWCGAPLGLMGGTKGGAQRAC